MTGTHLVTGAAGQDGVLLSRLLVGEGHRVLACVSPGSRNAGRLPDGVEVVEHDVRDIAAFARLVAAHRPTAVHNLAALSSVAASWDDPEASRRVNEHAVTGMLEVLASTQEPPAFVQASSADIVGRAGGPGAPVTEETPLAPVSPYGEAKAAAHRAVQAARDEGLPATNLILFGHTSELHAATFVLPRITNQAAELATTGGDTLWLFAPEVRRDWGSAADFVRAFALAAAGPAGDYVIGTGELHELREIAGWALERAQVDARVARPDDAPQRPNDVDGLRADTSRAVSRLGWTPQVALRTEIERMVDAELRRRRPDHR